MPMYSGKAIAMLLTCSTAGVAAQLAPATLSAWEDYVQAAESRLRSDQGAQAPWIDQVPGGRERLRGGEIIAAPTDGKPLRSVPHGLIHDWTGSIFIPGASISDVLSVLRDYDRYAEYYGPSIRSAQLLDRSRDADSFRIRYIRKALVVTVVLDIEYEARYYRIDEDRWYSMARSTSVRQIQDYGQPGERTLAADHGSGYVWRALGISRLEQSDGGVYLEEESVALSRKIPAELRWMVQPFVERLSKDLVISSLRRTRLAVLGRKAPPTESQPMLRPERTCLR
ncbi:MAG TPA: hypothetical protein VMG40_20660 [Bryobacteraceae bacterium]|nr:hypothetical protein [Bryobacteraceae bacterium]